TPTGEFATGHDAWISDDGRHVAFFSDATNLAPDQSLPETHIYVKNRGNGTVVLATRNSASGNVPVFVDPVGPPFISANGRFVVYMAKQRADNSTNTSGG